MTTTTRSTYSFDRIDRRTKRISSGLINAICDRIVEKINPLKIILFGSRAHGTHRKDSDLDFLIVLPNSHPLAAQSRRERAIQVLKLFPYRLFSMDVIVLTDGEINEINQVNEGEWDMILEVISSGKLIYEKG